MELKTRYVGDSIIELTASIIDAKITENVVDLNGKVDENLIILLREVADELEEHNNKRILTKN